MNSSCSAPVLKQTGLDNWGFAGQTVPDASEGLLHAPASHTPTKLANVFASVYACKNLGGCVWLDQGTGVIQGQKCPAGLLEVPTLCPLSHLC